MKVLMKAKAVAILTAFLMVFAMMPLIAFGEEVSDGEIPSDDPAYVETLETVFSAKGETRDVVEYDLQVGGTQVTSDNLSGKSNDGGEGGWTFNPNTYTLTLDNYKYNGPGYVNSMGKHHGIRSMLGSDLTIELVGNNELIVADDTDAYFVGIHSEDDLYITGDGILDVKPGIGSGNPYNYSYGFEVTKHLTIGGDCTVNATAPSGSVYSSKAIQGGSQSRLTTKENCTVIAKGGDSTTNSYGIDVKGDIKVNGGKVVATVGNAQYSHGILSRNGTIAIAPENENSVIEIEASGYTQAITGNVINTISGKGWTDVDGTEGEEVIDISETARALKNIDGESFKRIVFPYEQPTPTPTPTPTPAPTPTPTAVSGNPLTTLTVGKTSMTVAWQKVDGADGYDVFFAKCDGKGKTTAKNAQTIEGNNVFKWTSSGLKAGTAYKAYVKAYVMKGGKKQYVASSPLMHAYTQGYTKRYTNAKSVKVNKTKVSINKGKTFKIKAKVKKLKKGKKLMPKKHELKLRYLSTDTSIATVSKKGKIKGVKAGTCYVYAYAHNGVFKKIKVTVK